MATGIRHILTDRSLPVLISLNALVFVVIHAVSLLVDDDVIAAALALSDNVMTVLTRPWTLLTYMFAQWNFIHLLVNMLWLWAFGRIGQRIPVSVGSRDIYASYFAGGVAAAVVFLLSEMLCAHHGSALLTGSSGAVAGVIVFITALAPNARVDLMLIGSVRVWIVAVFTVGLCLASDSGGNMASTVAHFGGIAGGLVYALYVRLQTKKRKDRRAASRSKHSLTPEQELDRILDKVRRSGYGGLNAHERRRLYELSRHV